MSLEDLNDMLFMFAGLGNYYGTPRPVHISPDSPPITYQEHRNLLRNFRTRSKSLSNLEKAGEEEDNSEEDSGLSGGRNTHRSHRIKCVWQIYCNTLINNPSIHWKKWLYGIYKCLCNSEMPIYSYRNLVGFCILNRFMKNNCKCYLYLYYVKLYKHIYYYIDVVYI